MFDDLIAAASAKWNVPIPWIDAIIATESNWNPDATGAIGERGLMQISPATAASYGWDFSQMYDPAVNIDSGTHLLHDLMVSYGEDPRRVYSAYNSGNPDAWQTSTQVADNVNRFLDNLALYGTSTVGSSFGIVMILVLVGWFFLKRG